MASLFNRNLRSGKWTAEEEEYAAEMTKQFREGSLKDVKNGTSLRHYLSTKLNCNRKVRCFFEPPSSLKVHHTISPCSNHANYSVIPQRISKKFECSGYDGKQQFQIQAFSSEETQKREEKLKKLAEVYKKSLKELEAESKPAASDTAAAAKPKEAPPAAVGAYPTPPTPFTAFDTFRFFRIV